MKTNLLILINIKIPVSCQHRTRHISVECGQNSTFVNVTADGTSSHPWLVKL